MARPKTKEELVRVSEKNYQALKKLIRGMTTEQQHGTFSFEDRDRNVRDVLAHLHEWHNMMANWYETGNRGEKPSMPKKGYSWKTTPALNQAIWEHYQETELEEAKQLLEDSHAKMMRIINSHSDEELFTKKYYKWTNTTSLGSYLISATSSHYDWAIKKIRKYSKMLR